MCVHIEYGKSSPNICPFLLMRNGMGGLKNCSKRFQANHNVQSHEVKFTKSSKDVLSRVCNKNKKGLNPL